MSKPTHRPRHPGQATSLLRPNVLSTQAAAPGPGTLVRRYTVGCPRAQPSGVSRHSALTDAAGSWTGNPGEEGVSGVGGGAGPLRPRESWVPRVPGSAHPSPSSRSRPLAAEPPGRSTSARPTPSGPAELPQGYRTLRDGGCSSSASRGRRSRGAGSGPTGQTHFGPTTLSGPELAARGLAVPQAQTGRARASPP